MTQENLRACIKALSSKIPSDALPAIKNKLLNADDSIAEALLINKYDDTTVVLLLSILTGSFGVDRFYLGDVGLGVCKLLFGWLTLGIWPLLDIYFCFKKAQNRNLNKVLQILADYNTK